MKKTIYLLLFLLLLLAGCNNKEINSIGIKEKQTDKFVSIPCEKVSFSYVPGTVHYSPIYISFPITVHYLNENISYLIKSDFSSAYTYDYIIITNQISINISQLIVNLQKKRIKI